MYDITDSTIEILLTPDPSSKVAYTINNKQPVRSTIISDEPLFFMDYDHDIIEEDDDIYLSDELLVDNSHNSSKDYFCEQQSFMNNIINEFAENKDFSVNPDSNIKAIIKIISKSRYADELLKSAISDGVNIELSNNIEKSLYIKENRTILINPELSEENQVLLLAKELRRAWQHKSGALIQPLLFYPDQAILVNRTQNADLTINMVRIAWELQLAGYKESWEKIENSSLSDICHAFAKEAFMDFRTINNGKAASSAFEAWFLSERCNKFDKSLIQEMLADDQGYIFGKDMNSGISITQELISALGCVPYGKNYLSQYAHIIISDPIFTEVRDRANANFLWFIKFERSFRETEQELQNEIPGNEKNTVGKSNETRFTAEIIELPVSKKEKHDKSDKNGTGEIIWLHSWSTIR